MKTLVKQLMVYLAMFMALSVAFTTQVSAQTITSIDQDTFNTKQDNAMWSFEQSLGGVTTITTNSISGPSVGSVSSETVVYDSPSLWYFNIIFSNGGISIDAKSGFKDEGGNPDIFLDWNYVGKNLFLDPITTLVIGSSYQNIGSSENTLISNIKINGIELGYEVNTSSNNQFEGLLISNGDIPITSLSYEMTINISAMDARAISFEAAPSVVFVPSITTVPEPSTWALIGLGSILLAFRKKFHTHPTGFLKKVLEQFV